MTSEKFLTQPSSKSTKTTVNDYLSDVVSEKAEFIVVPKISDATWHTIK